LVEAAFNPDVEVALGNFGLEPYRVPVIDTTGAGDAFLAGLLAGWYHGLSWEEAGRVANATAALATTRQGATEGVDSWDQVMTLVKR